MSVKELETAVSERRDTPRVTVVLDAMVKRAQRPYQLFRTRDLSLDGAFVEVGPHRFSMKDTLDVALKIPVNGAPQIYRFHAHVARIAPLGVGMVFDHVNTESYAALMELVFANQPKGSY